MPLSIHVSLTDTMPAAHQVALPGWGRIFDIPNRMLELIFAGVFDRFPGLQMVAAEVDCGWLPYVKEQIDNNFQRLAPGSTFPIDARPSEYIERALPLRVHDRPDRHPPARRDRRGAHALVVGLSARVVGLAALVAHDPATFSGVPAAERHLILAGNAQRLYGFGAI